jgi:hypothetical protein
MSMRLVHRAFVMAGGVLLLGLCAPDLCRAQPFEHPESVAVGLAGNVFVTEPERHRIQKFDLNGSFIKQWGSSGSADGQFAWVSGIAVDATANVVYVADANNHRIQTFTTGGVFLAKWVTAGSWPSAIAVDAAGNVYVVDSALRRIKVFTRAGRLITSWGWQTGTGDGQFSPFGGAGMIAIDTAGDVYVSDPDNDRIMKFTPNVTVARWGVLAYLFVGWAGRCTSGVNCDTTNQRSLGFTCTAATCPGAPQAGTGDGQFSYPTYLAIGPNGVYVADTDNNRIQLLDASGFKAKWGSWGAAPGEFWYPNGVAVTGTAVYVADKYNDRIQKFDLNGVLLKVWGADVRLNASAGEMPGFVNPITLQPPSSTQSLITVTSLNQYAGSVDLTVSCCKDWDTYLSPTFTPPGVSVNLSTSQVTLPANGSATAQLNLSAALASRSGKYIARVTATNATVRIQQELEVVFTVAPAAGADISLSASPADPPGLGDLYPPMTAAATITVGSVNGFQGRVSLSAPCCFDVIDQKQASVPGVTTQLSAQTLELLPNASQTVTMTVTTSGTPTFGKFLVPVTVTHEGGQHEAKVAFAVLPQNWTSGSWAATSDSCRPSILAVTMRAPIGMLINAKETVPPPPRVMIGLLLPAPSADGYGWEIPLMEDPGLASAPSESIVVLQNRTDSPRAISTCSAVPRTIQVESGQDDEIRLLNGADSGIVFRQPFCTSRFLGFLWCTGWTWGDVVVMEKPGFWRVFGGRRTIFTIQH